MKIVALVGSLRKDSLNRKLLQNAVKVAPAGVELIDATYDDVPLYNQEVQEKGFPESVTRLGKQIAGADAVLFVTPEYNYSVPGVLKNAIDWISRLPDAPFKGKTALIMGASPGKLGTARAQYHLRQIGVFLDLRFLNAPEVMVGGAGQAFDEKGDLKDEATREFVRKAMAALVEAAKKVR